MVIGDKNIRVFGEGEWWPVSTVDAICTKLSYFLKIFLVATHQIMMLLTFVDLLLALD